jgi:glycosyltransferase involved in cell wall biosynthesis
MNQKPRLLRITTVPISLHILLKGQLEFMQQNGFEVLAVSAAGPEVDHLRKQGIAHIDIPMTRKITPVRDLLSLIRLIRLMRKYRPDLVHTHTPKAGLLGMLAARLCNVPVRLHTIAGLPLMERKGLVRKLLLFTEWITYACASAIYPNSVALAGFINNNIRTRTPARVIGKGSTNGIDTGHFSRTPELQAEAGRIRDQYGISSADVVFAFVGRIVRDKGISELVKAFKTTRSSHHGPAKLYLMLIGTFEQEIDPLPESDLKFLHEDPSVILAGFQQDVRPWIIASDIFVFPSYREGFPNVVMQSCCLEVPCIVSDINGCNEIIRHDETGLIVPAKNELALSAAMSRLAGNADQRVAFATRARAFVVASFAQQHIWQQLFIEYSALLDKFRQRQA